MIIAGAGGHGLEVYSVLLSLGLDSDKLFFFDDDASKRENFTFGKKVLTEDQELRDSFITNPNFCLGVGNPVFRKSLKVKLTNSGGIHLGILAKTAINQSGSNTRSDLMEFAFCGPEVKLGEGVLINTRAHVHHECEIGDFAEIGPGAIVLGGAKVGAMCRIGAGAVILPGVILGENVIVGAGAVVTKNTAENQTIIGVPAVRLGNK
ncbi:acetyltransferase [Algoriphagus sp.]|uniref:acetyltransferase n=1 Tax=Algoriphagus sp. TaxID=1872435 RepID=UPI00391C73B1